MSSYSRRNNCVTTQTHGGMIEFADEADVEGDVVSRLDEVAEGALLLGGHVSAVGERQVLGRQLVHQVPLPVLLTGGPQTRHLVVRQLTHVLLDLVAEVTQGCELHTRSGGRGDPGVSYTLDLVAEVIQGCELHTRSGGRGDPGV